MPIFILEFAVVVFLIWLLWTNLMSARENAPLDEELEAELAADALEMKKRVLVAKRSEVKSSEELKDIEEQLHDLEKGKK